MSETPTSPSRTAAPLRTVTLTVDGRQVTAPEGSYLLPVAREMGIEIPTLCDHPALEPVAACRLCMVEVTHPSWNGWSGLMTSCIYPVSDGLQVSTRSERVREARRGVLQLLAARCPGSDVIKRLAQTHGVDPATSRLVSQPEADDCILCGLCTRVCETFATGAIATVGRGVDKTVAPFADAPPEDCVGCGACAQVCPTQRIAERRSGGQYTIWDHSTDAPVARVDQQRCIGCGACEEACPFSVARVRPRATDAGTSLTATIAEEQCRGCGACVGACPSGAIDQPPTHSWHALRQQLAHGVDAQPRPRLTVLHCARARLPELPPQVRQVTLPCAGRTSVPLLLWAMAGHCDGVLVLGRHQQTCRFSGAEDPARTRVDQVRALLTLCGMDPERVRFVEPDPGPDGPGQAVQQHLERVTALGATELDPAPATLCPDEGLDSATRLFGWLREQSQQSAGLGAWLESLALPQPAPGAPALLAGELPLLATLDRGLLRPTELTDQLVAVLAVLGHLGYPGAGIADGAAPGSPRFTLQAEAADGESSLDQLLTERGATLPRPPLGYRVGVDGALPGQSALVRALGHEPVDVGPDPLAHSELALSPAERARAEQRLARAQAAGAVALLVPGPASLARWSLVTRHGTWRTSLVRPVTGVDLAHRSLAGVALAAPTPTEEVAQ